MSSNLPPRKPVPPRLINALTSVRRQDAPMPTRLDIGDLPVLLHLHLPKTAGMALNDVILATYGASDWTRKHDGRLVNGVYYPRAGIEEPFVPDESLRPILSSRDVRAVVGHFSFGLHEFVERPCQYVTLLRHPVDRVVSLYYHIKTFNNTDLHGEVVRRNMSLEQFVRGVEYREIDNGQVRRISGLDRPFGKCDQAMVETALGNITDRIAVAGLTERYVESVVLMKHSLKWPAVPNLKHKNVNKQRPRDEAVPESTYSLIVERNSYDMELYRLVTDRFQRQIHDAGRAFSSELASAMQRSTIRS
jgi:hypothetical protein